MNDLKEYIQNNLSVKLIDMQNAYGPYYEVQFYFRETKIITLWHVIPFNKQEAIEKVSESIAEKHDFPRAAFGIPNFDNATKLIKETIRTDNLDYLLS